MDLDTETVRTPLDDLSDALGLRPVTTQELATVLGVCPQRISQLCQDNALPEPTKDGKRNTFPLLEAVNWYIDYLREQ